MKTNVTVRNCPVEFRFQCSRQWEDLTTTGDPLVRHCDRCSNDVYLCTTDEATIAHARAGHCIAREAPDDSERRLGLGRPTDPPEITPTQEAALKWSLRESGIDDSIRKARDAPRCCPQCAFPAPAWRTTCRVCGYEMGRLATPPAD